MKYRLFLMIFLSSILDILLGTFLKISNVSIGWIVLYSGLFEAGVFLLANKGLAVKLYLGLDERLILLYGNIFIVFNALVYLLSTSQINLTKKV